MDKKSEGLIADLAGLKLELDTLKAKGVNTLMYSLLKQKYQEKGGLGIGRGPSCVAADRKLTQFRPLC